MLCILMYCISKAIVYGKDSAAHLDIYRNRCLRNRGRIIALNSNSVGVGYTISTDEASDDSISVVTDSFDEDENSLHNPINTFNGPFLTNKNLNVTDNTEIVQLNSEKVHLGDNDSSVEVIDQECQSNIDNYDGNYISSSSIEVIDDDKEFY